MNACQKPLTLRRILSSITLIFMAFIVSGCATLDDRDPLEKGNRAMYQINKGVDKVLLHPIATGYKAIVPKLLRTGVQNFFTNLKNPSNIVNNLLQADFKAAGQDTARFVVNSTMGWAGIFDLATPMGLPNHREDFGQTLSVWGYEKSSYLVLPILGPSTIRDTVGLVVDTFLNPITYLEDEGLRYGLYALEGVDRRSRMLHLDSTLESQVDEYSFVRGAYFDKRKVDLNDGVADESPEIEGFEFREEEL